jgi:hypothetical protein
MSGRSTVLNTEFLRPLLYRLYSSTQAQACWHDIKARQWVCGPHQSLDADLPREALTSRCCSPSHVQSRPCMLCRTCHVDPV